MRRYKGARRAAIHHTMNRRISNIAASLKILYPREKATLVPLDRLFQKTPIITPTNGLSTWENYLKILLFNQCLNLSNAITRFRVTTFFLFCESHNTKDFLTSSSIKK
jgi:hypothetical protein